MKSTVFWDIKPGLHDIICHKIVLLFTISLLTASLFTPANPYAVQSLCASLDKTVLHPRKLHNTGHGVRFEMIQAKYLMGTALTLIHQSRDIYDRQTVGKTLRMSTKEC
jgi:hypothetical protein